MIFRKKKEENNDEGQCKLRGSGRINDDKNISSWEEHKQLNEEHRRKMKRKFVREDGDETQGGEVTAQIVYVNIKKDE